MYCCFRFFYLLTYHFLFPFSYFYYAHTNEHYHPGFLFKTCFSCSDLDAFWSRRNPACPETFEDWMSNFINVLKSNLSLFQDSNKGNFKISSSPKKYKKITNRKMTFLLQAVVVVLDVNSEVMIGPIEKENIYRVSLILIIYKENTNMCVFFTTNQSLIVPQLQSLWYHTIHIH